MLGCIGQASAYSFTVGGLYYNKSGSYAIVTYGPTEYYGSIVIPSTVTYDRVTYNVNKIGTTAFSGRTGVISITIPNSVTKIDNDAFWGCAGLTAITIPNSVTSIGRNAFSHCTFLTSITLPNNLTSIESNTFNLCSSLTSITIPNSVASIGNNAFDGCSSLASVTIPSSVTSIGSSAFAGCSNLTSVTICNGVTNIGGAAFSGCSNLTSVINLATIPQTIDSSTFGTYGTLFVRKGYKEVYATKDYWKNFNICEIENALSDGEKYNMGGAIDYDTFSYTRTFTSTNWQALYVPFSMKYDDWKDKLDVYDIYNVLAYDEDNNGEIERTTVNMIRLKEGAVTEPNYPYVVRAKNAGDVEITLTDGTLYAAEENSIDCTSTKQKFTFTGTYEPMTGLATKGYYALSGGELKTAIDDAVTLKPQRWYMEVTNRNGSPAAATRVYLNPFGEENEVEGVKGVAVNVIGEETTYDLNGRAVNAAQLPKGLYVRGGKKIIVK